MRMDALVLVLLSFVSASVVGLSGAPAHAQEHKAGKVYRIGFLRAGEPPKTFIDAFLHGLRERGYVDGQDVAVEFRVTDGSIEQIPQLAEC